MNNNLNGVMQGRLLPRSYDRYQAFPGYHWESEFKTAKILGFQYIEWIYDETPGNPLHSEDGIKNIMKTIISNQVYVTSICGDYFMRHQFHSLDKEDVNLSQIRLNELIINAGKIGVKNIVIPCVDEAAFIDDYDINLFKQNLRPCLETAFRNGVNLCLETDLPPAKFLRLVEDFNHTRLRINYDTGNSAALGYNPLTEIETYGKYIALVHIKDRLEFRGPSVKLGQGSAKLELILTKLKDIHYSGNFTLQCARAENEAMQLEFTKTQYEIFKSYLERYFHAGRFR